jgi:hypothetical protein
LHEANHQGKKYTSKLYYNPSNKSNNQLGNHVHEPFNVYTQNEHGDIPFKNLKEYRYIFSEINFFERQKWKKKQK